jgi:hypothetical protein
VGRRAQSCDLNGWMSTSAIRSLSGRASHIA